MDSTMDSASETAQDSDREYRRREQREPPSFKYSEEEVDQLVRETMIKDSKLDACLDKFFISFVNERKWRPSCMPDPSLPDDKFEHPENVRSLKEQLVRDVETLLPGYYDRVGLSTASVQEKFDRHRSRYARRWNETWLQSLDTDDAQVRDDFLETTHYMLADKKARDLTESAKLSSKDVDHPATGGAPSLLQTCSTAALKELHSAVEDERSTAIFAYGGSIEVADPNTLKGGGRSTPEAEVKNTEDEEDEEEEDKSDVDVENEAYEGGSDEEVTYPCQSPPVRISWSSTSDGKEHKAILPPTVANDGSLDALVKDCTPATFARGDVDVLDPEYRRAGKLDPEMFCTNFHPADFGILDSIEQALLPRINSSHHGELWHRRVRAELYKLNVYSGPSGHFKAHVDTPRSDSQFGSLVVCLPSLHKGGNLSVRHGRQLVNFDWSDLSSSHIQWAAFYSDCEHEIATVTSGHRLTLTYNLYVSAPPSVANSIESTLVDPSNLPLYNQVKMLLQQPSFFPGGGVLGFFCSHSYSHTIKSNARSISRLLKGSDMALFSVLKALGLDTEVRPVLEYDGKYFSTNDSGPLNIPNVISPDAHHYLDTHDFTESDAKNQIEAFREQGHMRFGWKRKRRTPFRLLYGYQSHDLNDCEDIHQRWKSILVNRFPYATKEARRGAQIGSALHSYIVTDMGGEDVSTEAVSRANWPSYSLPGITWITGPKHEEQALTHLCYGNETTLGHRYSCAAMIAIVPPLSERLPLAD